MARTGHRRLTRLDPAPYEPWLHTRLLAADPGEPAVGPALFELLLTTRAEPLWRAAGARLMLLSPQECLIVWAEEALADGAPAWRLQPLAGDDEVVGRLLLELHGAPRERVAALRALAPRVSAPQIRGQLVERLADENFHVCSTAIEVLRPVAREAEVRDALLALFSREAPLKGSVDRALRRSLRAAAGDPEVQRALVAGLRGPRAWIAAEALVGAPASEALADALLAVFAETEHLFPIASALRSVAPIERVTAAVLPLLKDPNSTNYQSALRIVGGGVGDAARDALIAGLAHPIHWQRWTALEQLESRLADPAARAAVLGRLRDADDSVRMIALKILTTRDHDPEVRSAARDLLADPSEAVALAAAGLLARREPDLAAWAVLAPRVTEPRMRVYTKQWRSIDPFAQLGALVRRADVRDALAPMLQRGWDEHRAAVARVLQDATPCERIAALLTACIDDEDPDICGAAYSTLAAWVG